MPTPVTTAAEVLALGVAQLRERIEQRRKAGWQPEPGDSAQEKKKHWQEFLERNARKLESGEYIADALLPQLHRDRAMMSLGREFLSAAARAVAPKAGAFIEEGFPVNYQDPLTGETALHAAAGANARDALRVLLASGRCNFLLRDKQGRLASELALLYGDDPATARLLGNKERIQAAAQGIKLTRRPRRTLP